MMATTLTKSSLDVLSKKINAAYSSGISAMRTTVERAIECGGLLNEAKSQIKHGEWLPWLGKNCPAINRQTAAGWMKLAKSNVQPGIHLGVKEAIKLLTGTPAEAKEKPQKQARIASDQVPETHSNGRHDECANDSSHPLPIPDREPGDEEEPAPPPPRPPKVEGVNGKLDFDDNLIEGLFGKLIKAIDQRADVFKQKNSAYHKTCINRLDGFITAFNEWKATRR